MKKIFLLAGVIGFITLLGCDNGKNTDTNTDASATDQATIQTENVNTDSSQQTGISEPATVQASQPAGAPVSASSAAGMNPAHGEPNHRCDIAVGAPLNSPPGKNSTAAPTIATPTVGTPSSPIISDPNINSGNTQSIPSTPSPAAKIPTAPGMNPPHGEPGHDCSIAVGSPLKK